LADMQQGEDARGVEKLHWSVAHDVSGQVIERLLGSNHPLNPSGQKISKFTSICQCLLL